VPPAFERDGIQLVKSYPTAGDLGFPIAFVPVPWEKIAAEHPGQPLALTPFQLGCAPLKSNFAFVQQGLSQAGRQVLP
jgi:hypothetical protein